MGIAVGRGARSLPAAGWADAAFAWAIAFAVPSFYWALGGTAGLDTIAARVEEIPLAGNPAFVFGTGVLKVLAGLLALAAVRRWGRAVPRRPMLVAVWAVAAILTSYGLANLVDHGLMVAGLRRTPEVLGAGAVRWHLLLWDPIFVLGGMLFFQTARAARRHRSADPSPLRPTR